MKRNYRSEVLISSELVKLLFFLAFGFLMFISGVIVLIKLITMVF